VNIGYRTGHSLGAQTKYAPPFPTRKVADPDADRMHTASWPPHPGSSPASPIPPADYSPAACPCAHKTQSAACFRSFFFVPSIIISGPACPLGFRPSRSRSTVQSNAAFQRVRLFALRCKSLARFHFLGFWLLDGDFQAGLAAAREPPNVWSYDQSAPFIMNNTLISIAKTDASKNLKDHSVSDC